VNENSWKAPVEKRRMKKQTKLEKTSDEHSSLQVENHRLAEVVNQLPASSDIISKRCYNLNKPKVIKAKAC
jgi:predicted nuclease with TOPRIM domain